jgi:hypothetical protein
MRTPEEEHDRLVELASARGVATPPARPVPGECCDRGCEMCIWDYYERALTRWRERNAIA